MTACNKTGMKQHKNIWLPRLQQTLVKLDNLYIVLLCDMSVVTLGMREGGRGCTGVQNCRTDTPQQSYQETSS